MKAIQAIVKPHRLDAVLHDVRHVHGVTGVSVSEIRGFGRGLGQDGLEPHVRIDIVCDDALLDAIVDTIQQSAHTGLKGDGKIYVLPVEQAVRISTNERGEKAV